MKRIALIWIGFFAFSVASASEPVSVISGFDDVLRQAHNQNLVAAALKLFEKDKTFAGMSELYTALTLHEEGETKFTLVSGIFSAFCHRVKSFLAREGFPKSKLELRNWLTQWSVEDFKMGVIRDLLKQKPGERFIVIFDNSPASLNMASQLMELYPSQVSAVYLRETVHRDAPRGAELFVTSFDIANMERKANHLTDEQVVAVAEKILSEKNPNRIIPQYAYCPVDYHPCDGTVEPIAAACLRLEEQIQSICRSRI